jgi:hypothetical protein
MVAIANLVHQSSSSTGTGDFTLASVNGKQTFSDAFGTGGSEAFFYFISNRGAAEYEWGLGHMSDATTLVRDTVQGGTNGTSPVSFSAGTKDVTNALPVDEILRLSDYYTKSAADAAFQPLDADLTSLAALGSAADKIAYTTGAHTWAEAALTSTARNLLDDTSTSAMRTTLGLVIGTDVQAHDADLDAFAGVSSNGLIARTGAGTAAARSIAAGAGISVSNGDAASGNPTVAADIGKQSIWIPAGAMIPFVTNGAAAGLVELSTNKWPLSTLDFDTTTQEFAGFCVRMPKSWNEGTVTFVPVWSHASTTTNFGVVWGLDAVAISDDDAGDAAFGTAQTSTDTGGTTNDIYQGPESNAITIAGSPAAGDLVQFRIHRDPSNGSDTMAIDARLIGVLLLYTIDTLKDD